VTVLGRYGAALDDDVAAVTWLPVTWLQVTWLQGVRRM